MKRRALMAIAFGLMATLFLAPDAPAAQTNIKAKQTAEARANAQPASANRLASGKLVFGLIAPRGVEATVANWRAFADSLSARLKVPVELVATPNYKELVESFKAGQIDIAWLSNVPALEVVESGAGSVFATTVDSKGRSSYRSVLIVHKDSKLQSLKDVMQSGSGLVFGDGDVKSTSGHLVPLYYAFVQSKVNDPAALFKEIKTGNFKANATRVAQREVDVATNNDVEMGFFRDEQPQLAAQLRVIWTSQDIPQSPLVWRRDLPPTLKRQILQHFTSYGSTEAERKALQQANDLSGFKKSSNRQLVTVADLEMFSAWRKLWSEHDLPAADKKQKELELAKRGSRLELMLRAAEDI